MNTTKNYLTYEKARQRYVFQLRIPVDLRSDFDGRATIRKSLGNIPHDQAVVRANELATHYLAEFDRLRPATAALPAPRATVLQINAQTGQQLAATWQRRAINDLIKQLEHLQSAPEEDWERAIAEGQEALRTAREELRRGNTHVFDEVLTTLQSQFEFSLNGGSVELSIVARQFNAARVAYLLSVLEVLDGIQGVDAITPNLASQMPLVSLWGTAAKDLPDLWASRKRSIGQEPNLKTFDKYRLIAGDCDTILNGRPVEDLSAADLAAIKALWCAQGNGPSTVVGKLDLLKLLVGVLGEDERLEACFASARPAGGKLKTKRLPFTRDQVCAWVNALNADKNLSEDDKMLAHLLLLTATRLEELCQLTTDDVAIEQGHWQLRIANGQYTHTGAHIKNSASARRLMIPMGVLPHLDTWLNERIASGGSIFPDLTADKYGNLGTAVGKRLNRRLRKLLGPDRRLVLLSSRPTANRVMRRAGIDPRVRYRQLGHADQGIHDRHYDAAEHFDDEDLLPAAAIMAEWLAGCIRSDALPQVDLQTIWNNTCVAEADTRVLHESGEPASAVQQSSVEPYHGSGQIELAQASVTSAEASEPARSSPIAICGLHAFTGGDDDVRRGRRQDEVNRVLSPSGHLLTGVQKQVGLEVDVSTLQDACDDQLFGRFHQPALGRVSPSRTAGNLGSNSLDESKAQCLSKANTVNVAPDFETPGIATARHEMLEFDGLKRNSLIKPEQMENGFETPLSPQVLAGIGVPPPEIFDSSDAGVQKDCHEIREHHLVEGICGAPCRPAEECSGTSTVFRSRELLPKLGRYDGQLHEGCNVQLKQRVDPTRELGRVARSV